MKTRGQRSEVRSQKATKTRRALLAKVHIAVKDLGIFEGDYRDILMREFGVETAADLTEKKLVSLVEYFEAKGWTPSPRPSPARGEGAQIEALKERVGQVVLHSDLNQKRLRGLARKICGVEDVAWCHDVRRLKRLLAILERIKD